MSSSNLVRVTMIKETSYGVVPTGVHAFKVVQDITYTAVNVGSGGNSITIQYANTATAGSETVSVTSNAILVGIQSGVSTATQVLAAINASAAATALVTAAITGTAGTAQVTAAAVNLLGGTGELSTVRFTSESLSGTPNTVESQQIRTDRMSSGQVVVGLAVAGGINFELAKEDVIDSFLESAMYSSWDMAAPVTVDLSINASTKVITRATGSFNSPAVVVGDILKLSGFTNASNNVQVMVTEVTSASAIKYVGPTGMITEAGSGTAFDRADKLTIGTTKSSFTLEKKFIDLSNKGIVYKGMIVSELSLDFAYGALATGSFTLSGNDYDTVSAAASFVSYQRSIVAAATTQTLNGSVDMPFFVTSAAGGLLTGGLSVQKIGLKLNNNLNAQNTIGEIAPINYSAGTSAIAIDMSAYNDDNSWTTLVNKLAQTPFAVGFQVKNADGWYGFYMPAVQVSFPDPSSGGQNQDIILAMAGTAKVGAAGESALTIYRS